MKRSKKLYMILGSVLIILVVANIYKILHKKTVAISAPETSRVFTDVDGSEDVSSGSIDAPQVGHSTIRISYQEALVKYKDSKIEFGKGLCNANPSKSTFANGEVVMLDNKSPEERVINIDNTYKVIGYGFKLVRLTSPRLPIVYKVNCSGQENVAQIELKKGSL